ncbi:hypothetical protein RJ639_020130 [Escallonia herrerae]|uniref:Oxidoreductase N-terminal domain-containing protein n=1 Tax=Escallonia herrerae TaxID=1293975 RepID=A0AA88V7N4_9ASTE|nr:hypothetical protein RJ639_020130 [Escallonia herrerae]
MEVANKFIATKGHIEGAPQESDFELKTESLPLSPASGSKDVIVKNLNLLPFMLQTGKVIEASAVGRVVASGHPDFKKDDLVDGLLYWGEYSIYKGGGILNKLDAMGFPLSYHLGVLDSLKEKLGFHDDFNCKEETDLSSQPLQGFLQKIRAKQKTLNLKIRTSVMIGQYYVVPKHDSFAQTIHVTKAVMYI